MGNAVPREQEGESGREYKVEEVSDCGGCCGSGEDVGIESECYGAEFVYRWGKFGVMWCVGRCRCIRVSSDVIWDSKYSSVLSNQINLAVELFAQEIYAMLRLVTFPGNGCVMQLLS